MNRRQLILGTLFAPFIKPVVAMLPAAPAAEMGAAIYKPWISSAALVSEAVRRVNTNIEDELIFGRASHWNCRSLMNESHTPGSIFVKEDE